MENCAIVKKWNYTGMVGEWSVSCGNRRFKCNNGGIKLVAREDEELVKVCFDIKRKVISVIVNKPTLSEKAPRVLDLSNATEFFEEVRANIEEILMIGAYESVTPNEDRTVFEVR